MACFGCYGHLFGGWLAVYSCSLVSWLTLEQLLPPHALHCIGVQRLLSCVIIGNGLQALLAGSATCNETLPFVASAISVNSVLADIDLWFELMCLAKRMYANEYYREDVKKKALHFFNVTTQQGVLQMLQAPAVFYGLCGLICAAYISMLRLSSVMHAACNNLLQIVTGGCSYLIGRSFAIFVGGYVGHSLLQMLLQKKFRDVHIDESKIVGQLFLDRCPAIVAGLFIAASMFKIVTDAYVVCSEGQPTLHRVFKWGSVIIIVNVVRLIVVFIHELWHRTRTIGNIISNLATVEYESLVEEAAECSVCFSDFTTEDRILQTPCGHHFHQECLEPWLVRQQTCPTCRTALAEPAHKGRA
mmetsp:Transcript_40721/g.103539  ORF Transcript_40721/g.103539 Transcript_40721/m.103539 type:complete len:358 (-) Transcript_40721:169-1242(-)